MVVVPTLLTSPDDVEELVERLQVHYLAPTAMSATCGRPSRVNSIPGRALSFPGRPLARGYPVTRR